MKRFTLFALCLMLATAAFAQKGKGGGGAASTDPPPPPPTRVAVGPGPKTKAEAEAVQAMLQARAQSPDATIQAADTLVTKFPKSDFKSFALYTEANAWQQKNDMAKSQVFAEQALAADPKNYDAAILIANILATSTKDTDFDMNDKLTSAEKYAHDALDMLANAGKPVLFQMTDETWGKVKNEGISQAWQAIGTAALVRKKTDDAVAAYQKGLDANPDPFLMIRAGRALMAARKWDDAIAYDDKVLAMSDATAQAKTIATSDKSRATAAKGGK
jgi:tetratricopeptide (TPR) repeat protein